MLINIVVYYVIIYHVISNIIINEYVRYNNSIYVKLHYY